MVSPTKSDPRTQSQELAFKHYMVWPKSQKQNQTKFSFISQVPNLGTIGVLVAFWVTNNKALVIPF